MPGASRRSSQVGGQRRRRAPSAGEAVAVMVGLAAAPVQTLLARCCRLRVIVEPPPWDRHTW
jgi:hypothetical protein